MCGRYSFAPDLEIVNEHYNIVANPADVAANYNAAPTQLLPVITNEAPQQLSLFGGDWFRLGLKMLLSATSSSMHGQIRWIQSHRSEMLSKAGGAWFLPMLFMNGNRQQAA